MNYSIILFVIFVFGAKQIYCQNPKVTAFKELKAVLTNGEYDKDIKPELGENKSTNIGITLHIFDLDFIENEKKVSSDMYFRQMWTDSRIANPNADESIAGGQSLVDKIWTPDTFFWSSTSVKSVKYPKPNVFIRVSPNGEILFSERLQHTSRCHKKDENVFECPIELESYGYSAKDIKYSLAKGPESMSMSTNLDETDKKYKLANYTIEEKQTALSNGEYSSIKINLFFDNRPKEVPAVAETPKEPTKVDDMVKESKKIGKLFSGIKWN